MNCCYVVLLCVHTVIINHLMYVGAIEDSPVGCSVFIFPLRIEKEKYLFYFRDTAERVFTIDMY